jgi:hypothetical protein
MSHLRFPVVWTVVVGFFVAMGLSAAEKNAKSPTKPPSTLPVKHSRNPFAQQPPQRSGQTGAKIEDALASTTEMDVSDAPLGDVIDFLKQRHKIEIRLDKRVLEDVNITAKTPVTINVKGISLKSALRWMFRDMQPALTYMIKDEVLLITTPDVTAEEQTAEAYDVADLVVCRDEHDVLWDDYDSLIDLITSTIKATSWNEDPPGTIVGHTLGKAKVLVVFHNREEQERVANLLAKLYEVVKRHPDAAIPRRNRPTRSPGHGGRRTESSSGGSTSSAAAGAIAPSPAPKLTNRPADAAQRAEQKPLIPSGDGGRRSQ